MAVSTVSPAFRLRPRFGVDAGLAEPLGICSKDISLPLENKILQRLKVVGV